jgi:hypothetical protein
MDKLVQSISKNSEKTERKSRKELLRSMNVDPAKKNEFRVVPSKELSAIKLKNRLSYMRKLRACSDSLTPFRLFKAIARAVACILTIRRRIKRQ